MKREFYVDTPLGKLRVYARGESDLPNDYPGVYIDIVDEDNGDIAVAVVEYDSYTPRILTRVYGDVDREDPTDIIVLTNLPEPVKKKPFKINIEEILSHSVIVWAENYDEAISIAETEYYIENIVLTADDYAGYSINGARISQEDLEMLSHLEVFGEESYENQKEIQFSAAEVAQRLSDIREHSISMINPLDDDDIWKEDVAYLDAAIEMILANELCEEEAK